jgi:hypothetical protein
MPKGSNPNSRKNLIKNSDKTPEERRAHAAEMGRRSGQVRAALKSFRALDAETTTNEERMAMLANLKSRAKYNNTAFELYRDTVGLKPKDNVDVNVETRGAALDELEKMVLTDDTG